VPAELVAICEKAMAREPERRYADTLALAEDVRAYLENRVVRAYETGAVAELRKWVARNRGLATVSAAAILILVVGLIVSSSLFVRAKAETARADAKATEAKTNETIATAERGRADAKAKEAQQRADDVLSLSAIQELKELEAWADSLWPAFPEKIADYDRWLANARVLVDGRAADPARGIEAHPSLAAHRAKLTEIRLRAKPLSAEEVDADRRSSPDFEELEKARAKLGWTRRMLGEEPWPAEAEVEGRLAKESLPSGAKGLNDLAWPLVDPNPAIAVYGSEVKALLLARRAVAASDDAGRPEMRDTLAWALFKTGRFEDALAEEDRAFSDVDASRKGQYAGSLERLRTTIAGWTGDSSKSKRIEEEKTLISEAARLEQSAAERRTFEFADAKDRWWHEQLSGLVRDLVAFQDEKTGLFSAGTSPVHGWGIAKRRQEASTIADRSVNGPDAKRRWDEAIASIRDRSQCPKYDGLVLTPRIGLLPIGRDPESGLWEFAHLASGDPAERASDGKVRLQESTGLVFVLIPGGTFRMGAQSMDPAADNYTPKANENERPVHAVGLDAFFISKYEMTQGQWLRCTGKNPSRYGPKETLGVQQHDLLHPVEQVSWEDCTRVLGHLQLGLPTEAQWEYAARAGTTTPWWTGAEKESIQGGANLADAFYKRNGGPSSWLTRTGSTTATRCTRRSGASGPTASAFTT
jgi:formylglycine-generating enzyme required for sulfatase activity